MSVELIFETPDNHPGLFLTWRPRKIGIKQVNGNAPIRVRLENTGTVTAIFSDNFAGSFLDTLDVNLPANGNTVDIWISGKFEALPDGSFRGASFKYGDVSLAVIDTSSNDAIDIISASDGTTQAQQAMVRVRKNANNLTDERGIDAQNHNERDRFLLALAQLNDSGNGLFQNYRDMHTSTSRRQAHGNSGFLPWHRAYLLDLERELQNIDSTVSLPYWRFDQPAPILFSDDFLGFCPWQPGPGPTPDVKLPTSNPLHTWTTDLRRGISRQMRQGFSANTESPWVLDQLGTLNLGGLNQEYRLFKEMEFINPADAHGDAHTSFTGFIQRIHTAAKDPLFFLLHCNVDRLWALWQVSNQRLDPNTPFSYSTPVPNTTGHQLIDTMWPWNQVTGSPRPPTAPGGTFPESRLTGRPGLTPKVIDMIDYHGTTLNESLEFDYEDVPFV